MSHHNPFEVHLRLLGLKAAQVLFLTILISFLRFTVKILEKVVLLVKKDQKFAKCLTITRLKSISVF